MKICICFAYRAKYLEEGSGPRFECSVPTSSIVGCYMFQPIKPIVIKPREGDNRPLSLNYFSARVERVDASPELELKGEETENGMLVYWKPKEE